MRDDQDIRGYQQAIRLIRKLQSELSLVPDIMFTRLGWTFCPSRDTLYM